MHMLQLTVVVSRSNSESYEFLSQPDGAVQHVTPLQKRTAEMPGTQRFPSIARCVRCDEISLLRETSQMQNSAALLFLHIPEYWCPLRQQDYCPVFCSGCSPYCTYPDTGLPPASTRRGRHPAWVCGAHTAPARFASQSEGWERIRCMCSHFSWERGHLALADATRTSRPLRSGAYVTPGV